MRRERARAPRDVGGRAAPPLAALRERVFHVKHSFGRRRRGRGRRRLSCIRQGHGWQVFTEFGSLRAGLRARREAPSRIVPGREEPRLAGSVPPAQGGPQISESGENLPFRRRDDAWGLPAVWRAPWGQAVLGAMRQRGSQSGRRGRAGGRAFSFARHLLFWERSMPCAERSEAVAAPAALLTGNFAGPSAPKPSRISFARHLLGRTLARFT